MKLNINGNIVEVSDEDLTTAITEKKESIEIKNDSLVIRSAEDDKSLSDNLRKEGITAGAEIGRKEVIKGLGIEGEGLHKSDASSIEAIQNHSQSLISQALTDAKIEPNAKLEEKDKDIASLKMTIDTLTKSNEEINSNFKSYKNNQLISNAIANEIPDNILLGKQDTLAILNTKIKLAVNENGVVHGVGSDGQPLKDASLNLLSVKDIVANVFNENQQLLKPSSGGAGGTDSGGGNGKQSLDDFTKEMKDAGNPPNSPVFTATMNERIKAGTLAI